ncbi:hypothetical protein FOXYSP1_17182 [Fusarium oxysporum f. sp. phaseoli]
MQVVARRLEAAKSRSSVRHDAGEAGGDRVATRRRHAPLVLDWQGWRTENSIDSFVSPSTSPMGKHELEYSTPLPQRIWGPL